MNTILKILGIVLIATMVLGCAGTSNNQDNEWLESARTDTLILGTDLIELGGRFETLDATSIMSSSIQMSINCESALRDSQSYTVSPDLSTAKHEYECGLFDYMTMADLAYDAAVGWEQGDISNAITEIDQMTVYLESGRRHTDAAAVAIR